MEALLNGEAEVEAVRDAMVIYWHDLGDVPVPQRLALLKIGIEEREITVAWMHARVFSVSAMRRLGEHRDDGSDADLGAISQASLEEARLMLGPVSLCGALMHRLISH